MQLWQYCLLVTARLLYMFRTLSASIIRSTKNCSSSIVCVCMKFDIHSASALICISVHSSVREIMELPPVDSTPVARLQEDLATAFMEPFCICGPFISMVTLRTTMLDIKEEMKCRYKRSILILYFHVCLDLVCRLTYSLTYSIEQSPS